LRGADHARGRHGSFDEIASVHNGVWLHVIEI
jgi:hypothetical protein